MERSQTDTSQSSSSKESTASSKRINVIHDDAVIIAKKKPRKSLAEENLSPSKNSENSDGEDNKRAKIEEPEDPMLNMDLDPKPQDKGKNKIVKEKCLECGNEERNTNPINELGICVKCDIKRETLERYGSKTTIRQCCV